MAKWTVWFLLIVISFAFMEGYAIQHHTATLSRTVWEISAAFPPFPLIVGLVVGFLACHFWWGGIVAFRPVGSKKGGGQ